jgi:hypothetical protein
MSRTIRTALAIAVALILSPPAAVAQDANARALAFYEAHCAHLDLEFVRGHTFGRAARPEPYLLANEDCVRTAFYLGLIDRTYDANCRHLLLFFCL